MFSCRRNRLDQTWLAQRCRICGFTATIMPKFRKQLFPLYKEINTPEFRKLCRQVSWMRSCQTMLGFIYAIAPLKIVYRMYRRRPDYKVSYDEFLEILKQVPENDNMCIVRDDKMILKTVLRENLYERIEEYQEIENLHAVTGRSAGLCKTRLPIPGSGI